MIRMFRFYRLRLIAGICSALVVGIAVAEQPSDFALTSFSLQTGDQEYLDAVGGDSADSPFSFDVTYYLYSDYVFRGINFSEFPREGRERLNHQMTTTFGADVGLLLGRETGAYGTISLGTFFEWFAGQKSIDPIHGGQNLQEVDYVLSWSYDIEPIETTFTLGYTFYVFPNAKPINTSEWWFSLENNDAWMWKWLWPDNDQGVLNPSFFFAQDVDVTDGGVWMEIGLNHGFALCENLTITPSVVLAIDHRYLDPLLGTGQVGGAARVPYVQYALTANYDMTQVLALPDWAGSVVLSAFLAFSDARGTARSDGTIQDEFFGGMSLGWSF